MPSIIESTDYELFDYSSPDDAPLPLDEAMRKASQLRAAGNAVFYRVVPVDSEMAGFRVVKVTPEEVRAGFYGKVASFRAKWMSQNR
jgi:hypothetical protein